MQTERTWSEWFTSHSRSAPFQIHHMRELAETTVSATDTAAVRVSGSTDQARLPYRVDPADDADLLRVHLLTFGQWVAERAGGASPGPYANACGADATNPKACPSAPRRKGSRSQPRSRNGSPPAPTTSPTTRSSTTPPTPWSTRSGTCAAATPLGTRVPHVPRPPVPNLRRARSSARVGPEGTDRGEVR